jgi:hypothetical protein
MSKAEAKLKRVADWFDSGDGYALVRAYRDHYRDGTTGTEFQHGPRPAVINEHGVLTPERFEEYMFVLDRHAHQHNPENEPSYTFETLALLESTLRQMIGSMNFGERTEEKSGKPLKELFEEGRQMATAVGAYLRDSGYRRNVTRGDERGGR